MRTVGGQETKRHVLVDGNNLLHRTHYAFVLHRLETGQPMLTTKSGFPTGLIYGFLETLSNWLVEIPNISDISVFFDGYSKRRKELDPTYKANRDNDDGRGLKLGNFDAAPLKLQTGFESSSELDILAHVLQLLGCNVYHHPDEEADDVIASFCKAHRETIRIIVSSDKDFFQLLQDPRVVCYVPGKAGDRMYDAERSAQYWADLKSVKVHIPPTHVRMFKTLCGDSSDGISGIDRLRKKVAITLCHHQNVDELVSADLSALSETERTKILSSVDRLKLNYELVGFNDSVDLIQCLRPSLADFGLARKVMQEDLSIVSVNTAAFRVGTHKLPPPAPLPLEDWLADI